MHFYYFILAPRLENFIVNFISVAPIFAHSAG